MELIYFTSKTCGVCMVLKPKLLEAVQENFPEVNIRVVYEVLNKLNQLTKNQYS